MKTECRQVQIAGGVAKANLMTQHSNLTAEPADGEKLGYKVLIDVFVSVTSQDGFNGVVRHAATNGTYVDVHMLGGSKSGTTIRLPGTDITPVPRADILPGGELECVEVLDGAHQCKKGNLQNVRNDTTDPEGVVRFEDGSVGMLPLSLVAICCTG